MEKAGHDSGFSKCERHTGRQTMRESSYPSENKLASAACKRCGCQQFVVEIARPPHYMAERCGSCGLFSRFIPKPRSSELKPRYPEVSERIGSALPADADLLARVAKLERAFAGYDTELKILVRAILDCGMLRGKGGVRDVDVNDELVAGLGETLAREEKGR
jgi:hypothetical protein